MFIITSYISNATAGDPTKFNVIAATRVFSEAELLLKTTAVKYVCDEVGKNNYADTLNNNIPAEECALGYVLKYIDTSALPSSPWSISKCVKAIKLSKNIEHKVQRVGWIYNDTKTATENIPLGFFAVYKLDVEPQVDAIEMQDIEAHKAVSTYGKDKLTVSNYDAVVCQLRDAFTARSSN